MSERFDPTQTIWNRRQLLKAGGVLLVSNGVLSLVGCGGGGGREASSGKVSLERFSGLVTLPPGVSSSSLVVGVGLGTATLANGRFSASMPSDAPSLVTVLDPSKKSVVLMGMTNPGSSGPLAVDATSTAVALVFFSVGGGSMSRDGIKPLVDAIKADAATATLASVIGSRIQVDPFAVGNGDAQIVSALSTAARAVASGTGFPAAQRGVSRGETGLLQIQPTGEVDGVTFLNLDTTTGFAVQNTKRRLGYVYTYLATHVDFSGAQSPVNPPTQVGGILEVPSTSSLLKLGSGWAPVTSAPVPMALLDGDSKSIYTLVYLAQVYGASEPAFFSDPQWAGEVGKWRASLGELGQDTFIGFFANIVLSAVGFGGLAWAHAQLAATIASLRAIPSISDLIDLAAGEDVLLGDLAKQALTEFLAGDLSQKLLADMANLVSVVSKEAGAYLAEGAATATGLSAVQAAVAALVVSGAVILAADVGAIAADTTFGEKGDLWTATVVRPTLTLNPQNPTAKPGDRVTFSVKPPSTVKGTIEYDWTQTGTFSTLSSSDGKVGSAITTTAKNVDLVTTGSDQGTITVAVTAYLVEGSTRTEIGQAQTLVTLGNDTGGGVGTATITISGFSDLSLGGKVYQDGTYTEEVSAGYSYDGTGLGIGSSNGGAIPFGINVVSHTGSFNLTFDPTVPRNGDGGTLTCLIGLQFGKGTCSVSSTPADNGKRLYQFSWDFREAQAFGAPDLHTHGSGSVLL